MRLPFLKVWLLDYFACVACVHQCTYYQNDGHLGKGLHLEFFIGHTIFSKSGLNRGIFSVSLFGNSGNEHRTGMEVILKNGFHPEFLLATSQWPFLSVDCTLPWWSSLCTPMNLRAMPAGILYPWQV